MNVEKILEVYLWDRDRRRKVNYSKTNKFSWEKKLRMVLKSILEIPKFPLFRYRLSRSEAIMLTFSTFKRDKKNGKWRDPYVEAAISQEKNAIYVIEKIQRGDTRNPSYYESTCMYTPLNLTIGALSKVYSFFQLNQEFCILRDKSPNLYSEIRKIQSYYIHALLLSKVIGFLIGESRKPKSIYVTQIHSIESMAFSLYGASIDVPVCEVQHGLIVRSSKLYDFSYRREEVPFYPNRFLVKNHVVRETLIATGRCNPKDVNEIYIKPRYFEQGYQYDFLVCLSVGDLSDEVAKKIVGSKNKKYLIRAHPGFKNPFINSDFRNLEKVINVSSVDISIDNSLEEDIRKSKLVVCGASTVIIDAVTLGRKVITWDDNAATIFHDYKDYISSFEEYEL